MQGAIVPAVVAFDVEWFLALASQHGEDNGPQREVDDLETLLRTGWATLSEQQRVAVLGSEEVLTAVELELMTTAPDAGPEGAAWLIKSAELHGEGDDPDHQSGDLQGFLRAVWERMSVDQQRKSIEDSDVSDAAELGGCGRALVAAGEELDSEDWELVLEHFGLDDSFRYDDQQVADFMNAFTLQTGVRSEDAHTQHPMKRAA